MNKTRFEYNFIVVDDTETDKNNQKFTVSVKLSWNVELSAKRSWIKLFAPIDILKLFDFVIKDPGVLIFTQEFRVKIGLKINGAVIVALFGK